MKAVYESEWVFDWKQELLDAHREVYKLIALKYPLAIQGLMSVTIEYDHIMIQLIESASSNRARQNYSTAFQGILSHIHAKSRSRTDFVVLWSS